MPRVLETMTLWNDQNFSNTTNTPATFTHMKSRSVYSLFRASSVTASEQFIDRLPHRVFLRNAGEPPGEPEETIRRGHDLEHEDPPECHG